MPDARTSSVVKKSGRAAATADAAQYLMAIVDVAKGIDANLTERARIAADRDKEIARINAASQVLQDYLDRAFGERRELHRSFFSRLNKAIEDGDPETVQACVTGIVEVNAAAEYGSSHQRRSSEGTRSRHATSSGAKGPGRY